MDVLSPRTDAELPPGRLIRFHSTECTQRVRCSGSPGGRQRALEFD